MFILLGKKTDLGDFLPGHDSRTAKMKFWPRKDVKMSESESKSKGPEKTFLYRVHSCTHEQERTENPCSSV